MKYWAPLGKHHGTLESFDEQSCGLLETSNKRADMLGPLTGPQ
jgi:hypothetical protein